MQGMLEIAVDTFYVLSFIAKLILHTGGPAL
jgi:hypothetical protein